MRDVEFLLGLLEKDGAGIAPEDLDGPHGDAVRIWQDLGFVSRESGMNPHPSCPHCGGGVPYLVEGRYLCHICHSAVDPRHLSLWPLDREAFLAAMAGVLRLRGGVQRIDEALWQLGTGEADGEAVECFYRCCGPLSDVGQRRLEAYRRAIVLHVPSVVPDQQHVRSVPLLRLFSPGGTLTPVTLTTLLNPFGAVSFEAHSGALWVGDALLGEVPVGSREYHFLACLAERLDRYVPYADLKREVLRRSAGNDETEEATFCHGLKRRIKKRWIVGVDRLIVTTNKGEGYRLRAVLPGA